LPSVADGNDNHIRCAGQQLTGWKPEGNASWAVEGGAIVGRQGPNGAPGDLFTEREYGDFELMVTLPRTVSMLNRVLELDEAEKVVAARPEDCICCRLCELRCPDMAIEIETE